jgi:hypothetical protein
MVAVVVRGGSADTAEVEAAGLASAVPLADPDGAIARRFGIRTWPTTVLADENGTVVRVLAGGGGLDPSVPDEAPR